MIRVLVIFGSPRQHSNSEPIIRHILQGITSVDGDIATEIITLREKRISPCLACDGCYRQPGCVQKDDMHEIYTKLDLTDLLIVSSPIYFNSVSAQLKALIDRTQAIWASKYILKKPLIDREKTRVGVFVATAGNPDDLAEFTPATKVMELFFKAVNTQYFQNLFIANTDKEPVINRPEVLTQAYELGKKMLTEYQNAK